MKKHILFVTIDTLRADDVGCYGIQPIGTPNLDTFPASGVRFQHYLTRLAAALPPHCSLMTGCTPLIHSVNWNGVTPSHENSHCACVYTEPSGTQV